MADTVLRTPAAAGGQGPSARESQLIKNWLPNVAINAEGLWPAGGVAYALYDFATDGGAVSDISLGVSLPANAVVLSVTTEEVTDITSGGAAQIAIKAGSAVLVAAQVISNFTGTVKQETVAAHAKSTSAAALTLTPSVAALTAGKLKILVHYVICA